MQLVLGKGCLFSAHWCWAHQLFAALGRLRAVPHPFTPYRDSFQDQLNNPWHVERPSHQRQAHEGPGTSQEASHGM